MRAFLVGTSAVVAGCERAGMPAGLGSLQVTLSATACAQHCVDRVNAELYRDGESVPLGPTAGGACGDALIFPDLPAGHRIYVRVVVGAGDDARLVGLSESVTVVASAETSVSVALEPLAGPRLDALVPAELEEDATELELIGAGFGTDPTVISTPAGAEVVAATDRSVRVLLPKGATSLTLSACGQDLGPIALPRTSAGQEAAEPVTLSGCPGGSVVAAAALGPDFAIAVRCASGGELHTLAPCARTTVRLATLEETPIALAATDDAVLYVTRRGPTRTHGDALVPLPWSDDAGAPLAVALAVDRALVAGERAVFRYADGAAAELFVQTGQEAPIDVAIAGLQDLVLLKQESKLTVLAVGPSASSRFPLGGCEQAGGPGLALEEDAGGGAVLVGCGNAIVRMNALGVSEPEGTPATFAAAVALADGDLVAVGDGGLYRQAATCEGPGCDRDNAPGTWTQLSEQAGRVVAGSDEILFGRKESLFVLSSGDTCP